MVNFKEIEQKWQKAWEEAKIFEANPEKGKQKFFVTFPFPYMNGPLHIGHTFTATRVDVFARYKRMQGFNVLFPWAWHYTGETIPGVSKRIERGDEVIIRGVKEIDGVPDEELKKFINPIYLANYYRNDSKEALKKIGFSVDWRREFTTIDECFKKFIEWQYLRLKDKGYVTKGTYPVVWCPTCESPTGDHDRLEGEGVSPTEFILLKFKCGDIILPAATLRLETIYGVTNMWINPEVEYVKAKVNGENWLISQECFLKLKQQDFEVEEIEKTKGWELIGKLCYNPILKNEVIILPASFVDPNIGSGIVMSVPSHAPYDYVGLNYLLKNPAELGEYGIKPEQVEKIKPISLITLEGFGEHPAIEICEKMQITSLQEKEKLDKATEEIYGKEFHLGVLKPNTEKYAGKKVIDVKPVIIEDFLKAKIAVRVFDLPEKVVCRCTTICLVKILKDQWFLDYGKVDWKKLAKDCLESMKIYPPEAKKLFEQVIDWLKAKACVRKSGLGTKLPWDQSWLVETLSDSTIYPAFYTISHLIKKYEIPVQELTPDFFNYVFFGEKLEEENKLWKVLREEFTYWYPVDFRNSAKELVPNHLTFYIFHHVAVFPPELWPRSIGVNGMVNIEGQKMSKSKGIFITLNQALSWRGADVLRFTLINSAEGLDDVDFRRENIEAAFKNLNSFYSIVEKLIKAPERKRKIAMDSWLLSRLQTHIVNGTQAYEQTKFKTAIQHTFFNVLNDVQLYLRRCKEVNKEAIGEFLENLVKLIAPVIPHLAEEL
ncbi:MAG: leucine--tRNA ligase, partial [Candidatus Aenigmarchaeota archaeon]|nr:leucine--tRNA ligase [Candidatus Aenigmarchaeota archaeon]